MTSDQKRASGSQKPQAADWKRMRFKKNKVWMAVDSGGEAVVKADKVLVKYQLEQDYEYWVRRENVVDLEAAAPASDDDRKTAAHHLPNAKASGQRPSCATISAAGQIRVYTDGASSGNPGPAGIGVVLRYGEHEKEISQFIGDTTNNIAELKAIEIGLAALKNRDKPVRLFTDSKYAHGLLMLNWKPKKNRQLVQTIKNLMTTFKDVKIIKVKGHSGHPENERADYLATSAVKKAKK